jgi:predicted Holliday junction resolvase-like endonuclease
MIEKFSPGDFRFLGSPVDFVVFDGLTGGAVERIVLVEVKSGDPRLNDRQAQIKAAITSGALRVDWVTLKMPRPPGTSARRRRPRIIELPPESA